MSVTFSFIESWACFSEGRGCLPLREGLSVQFYGYAIKHNTSFQQTIFHEGLYFYKNFQQKYPSLISFLHLLLKLYWAKLKIHKRSKLVKVDNKVIIVLIFINIYFILIILMINNPSTCLLSHILTLHISLHLILFTIHTHLSSIHRCLQSYNNKVNKPFGAGKPIMQINDINPFLYIHPLYSRSEISGDCCRSFQRESFF